MEPGDVVVFPHGDAHLMSSAEGCRRRRRRTRLPASGPLPGHPSLWAPRRARDTTFVCGFLGCDLRPYNPLLASLPPRMHREGDRGRLARGVPAAGRRRVAHGPRGKRDDAHAHGGAHVRGGRAPPSSNSSPPQRTGWLAGLKDPVVGPALTHLHESPARAWTLPELAQAARPPRARFSPSASRTSSACRRCSTSRSGACSSRPRGSRGVRPRWPPSGRTWATSRRPRSAARSSGRRASPRGVAAGAAGDLACRATPPSSGP